VTPPSLPYTFIASSASSGYAIAPAQFPGLATDINAAITGYNALQAATQTATDAAKAVGAFQTIGAAFGVIGPLFGVAMDIFGIINGV
jgi:hypothetical protein